MTTTRVASQPSPIRELLWPPKGRHRKKRSRRTANTLFALAVSGCVLIWALTLRPQSLGGPAGYVMVRGISMIPTYHTGDLVIVRKEGSYHAGQIVAYRIPKGEVGEGIIVIHRIIGGGPQKGFVIQGDNNPAPDDWHPKVGDVVGRAWLLVPRGGAYLAFIHSPLPLASLAAGIAVAILISDDEKKKKRNAGKADKHDGHETAHDSVDPQ